MTAEWCMEERCRCRHWLSGSMPTHQRGEDCPPKSRPVSAHDQVARAWHDGSFHAADGTPFGGPLCNCDRIAGRIMPMLADAWSAGYDKGEECYADAMNPDHLCFTNPFESEEDRHVDQ